MFHVKHYRICFTWNITQEEGSNSTFFSGPAGTPVPLRRPWDRDADDLEWLLGLGVRRAQAVTNRPPGLKYLRARGSKNSQRGRSPERPRYRSRARMAPAGPAAFGSASFTTRLFCRGELSLEPPTGRRRAFAWPPRESPRSTDRPGSVTAQESRRRRRYRPGRAGGGRGQRRMRWKRSWTENGAGGGVEGGHAMGTVPAKEQIEVYLESLADRRGEACRGAQ